MFGYTHFGFEFIVNNSKVCRFMKYQKCVGVSFFSLFPFRGRVCAEVGMNTVFPWTASKWWFYNKFFL